jgi:glycosyltransferase involved in cell wall biosynthesis
VLRTHSADRPLKVLHILTLNSRNGEYGGPVRVARELCKELNTRGIQTHIFSGAIAGFEPESSHGLNESHVLVKPCIRSLPLSSLWSWKAIPPLRELIKESDVVHIHFARDLIPFLAATLAIIYRKPFVTQTHGMIRKKTGILARIIDPICTIPLLRKAKVNLVLSASEEQNLKQVVRRIKPKIFINGISFQKESDELNRVSGHYQVVFCARLDPKKGVKDFMSIAEHFTDGDKIDFQIFGPDGGELEYVTKKISDATTRNKSRIEYRGHLKVEEVKSVLENANLLILPSREDAYPMVVLEALSEGTPVLISRNCGNSGEVREIDPNFVCESGNIIEYVQKVRHLLRDYEDNQNRSRVISLSKSHFDIGPLTDKLIRIYGLAANPK